MFLDFQIWRDWKRSFAPFLFLLLSQFAVLGQFEIASIDRKRSVFYKSDEGELDKSLFKVYLKDYEKPMLGQYLKERNKLIFIPLIPLNHELHYTAKYDNGESFHFQIAAVGKGNLKVLNVYPSLDSLPSNILKFYIEFSESVGSGQAYEMINILDETGKVLPADFVNLGTELWNKERTRLTMWLDPGRIKRDLLKNQTEGEVLEVSKKYTLFLDKRLVSINLNSMETDYEKSFITLESDRIKPKVSEWMLEWIKGKNSIKILFPEAMDYGSTIKAFEVFTKANKKVVGDWQIGKAEKR